MKRSGTNIERKEKKQRIGDKKSYFTNAICLDCSRNTVIERYKSIECASCRLIVVKDKFFYLQTEKGKEEFSLRRNND